MSEDLRVLREILQRELETINAYERMLDRVGDPSLRKIIEHVTDEEREHVAEMYHLIVERDEQQRVRSEKGLQQLAGMALLSPEHQTAAAAAGLDPEALISSSVRDDNPPPPPFFPDGAWSVGPMKVRSP